jgi:hypothetical protein
MKFKLRSKDQYVRACYFRGMVLNGFISLENEISACLAEFFSGNNDYYWTFMNVIADRMTFEAKRSSLKFLMEEMERKDGFIKTKSNRYRCGDFFNELRLLIEQRNYFAHYNSYKMKSQEAYAIVLSDFRDKYTEHFYMEEDIASLLERIQIAMRVVANIYMEKRELDKANE